MRTIIILLTTTLTFMSCEKDVFTIQEKFANVDPELWQFYSSFQFEADKRGVTINLENLGISGVIEEIHESGVAGQCQYGSAINNHVTIDETFWKKSSNSFKEFIVFHELGHCALFRGHDESQNEAGLCLSIMRSGTGNCRDAYNATNREAYLDELFFDQP